jgi:NADP-dependent 3-hydroxy acid dehydrogenase YdfG
MTGTGVRQFLEANVEAGPTRPLNPRHRQVIAVLGAGPGIGAAVATKFVSHGFAVALVARTLSKLESIAAEINKAWGPNRASCYVADLTKEESVNQAFEKIRQQLGDVNVLVYNAGARRVNGRSVVDTTAEEFENFTKTNLFGAFYASRCVLPAMLSQGAGTIIFTGATGSLRGAAGLSSFSPGKFGLRALAQVIARENQSKGIHAAHLVIDGPVDGPLIGGVVRRQWERAGESEKLEKLEEYISQPDDLAQIYWMLHTQPKSAWTQELDVRAMREGIFSRI